VPALQRQSVSLLRHPEISRAEIHDGHHAPFHDIHAGHVALIARDIELERERRSEAEHIAALAQIPRVYIQRPGTSRETTYRVISEQPAIRRETESGMITTEAARIELLSRSKVSSLVQHYPPCACAICRIISPLWINLRGMASNVGDFSIMPEDRDDYRAFCKAFAFPEIWLHEETITWHRREPDGTFAQLGTIPFIDHFNQRANRPRWAVDLGIKFDRIALLCGEPWRDPWEADARNHSAVRLAKER
jgi:hypothetical protein